MFNVITFKSLLSIVKGSGIVFYFVKITNVPNKLSVCLISFIYPQGVLATTYNYYKNMVILLVVFNKCI